MNYGFEPLPDTCPVVLAAEDEPDRSSIQLYHRVAGARDLSGKEVLEVGSGRGGGAAFVARYLRPQRVVGLDVSPQAVAFSRARHCAPGLTFEVGDAERLRFAPASFDTILNVESSHCYGDAGAFFSEVARVLRPGGYFLYADFRARTQLDAWRAELRASGLRLVEESDITSGVVTALDTQDAQKRSLIEARIDRLLVGTFSQFAGLQGSLLYDKLRAGSVVYCAFVFQNSNRGAGLHYAH